MTSDLFYLPCLVFKGHKIENRARHTRVIPGSFQLNIPIQPQTNHNHRTSMLTRHCISYIYMQLTVYHSDHITITRPTHNSTEELLHPNIIKVSLPVSLNQNCHYGRKPVLWRVWSQTTTLPAFKTRQVKSSQVC